MNLSERREPDDGTSEPAGHNLQVGNELRDCRLVPAMDGADRGTHECWQGLVRLGQEHCGDIISAKCAKVERFGEFYRNSEFHRVDVITGATRGPTDVVWLGGDKWERFDLINMEVLQPDGFLAQNLDQVGNETARLTECMTLALVAALSQAQALLPWQLDTNHGIIVAGTYGDMMIAARPYQSVIVGEGELDRLKLGLQAYLLSADNQLLEYAVDRLRTGFLHELTHLVRHDLDEETLQKGLYAIEIVPNAIEILVEHASDAMVDLMEYVHGLQAERIDMVVRVVMRLLDEYLDRRQTKGPVSVRELVTAISELRGEIRSAFIADSTARLMPANAGDLIDYANSGMPFTAHPMMSSWG